jgi:hypothetical protein
MTSVPVRGTRRVIQPKKVYAKPDNESIQICACSYQMEKGGDWRYGLMINSDMLIIDMDGKPVMQRPWAIDLHWHDLSIIHSVRDRRHR